MSFFIILTSLLFFSNSTATSSYGLHRSHLTMSLCHNPPYTSMIRLPDGNFTGYGSTWNIFVWLSKRLNFTFDTIPIVDGNLIKEIGVSESAIRKVLLKEADAAIGGFIITPKRFETLDFTFMTWVEPYNLAVPKPQPKSRLFAFIRPFQPTVWFLLIVSAFCMIAVMSWLSWTYDTKFHLETAAMKDGYGFNYFALYVINVLSNHGMYTPFSKDSFRIVASCWLLATSVLVYGYCSIVVSSLTVPSMQPPINTLEDLASSKEVSIIIRGDFVIGQQIMAATSGLFKTLGDKVRAHPDRQLCLDYPSLNKRMESGKYAFPFLDTFNRAFIINQFAKDKTCRFQLSPPLGISSGSFHILVQKDSKYTASMSYGLGHLWETGLTRFWLDQTMPTHGAEKCLAKKESKSSSVSQVPIRLEDLTSAFLILGLGLGMSVLCFLLELIRKRFEAPPVV